MKRLFNMPDFVFGREIYGYFLDLKKQHSYAFYENYEIISVFGCFPNCIWNGGGHFNSCIFMNGPRVKEIIEIYNKEFNLPIRFTFTNPSLEEKHYYDTYGNLLAELGHNGKNEIVVSDPKFEEYLRANYPNYKYVKSIIGTENQPVFLDDKYYLTVMRRRMNNNWDYLEKIPMEQRGKIEFLCTDPCPDNCPRIYSHYRAHGRTQLNYGILDPNNACTMSDIKGPFMNKYCSTLETSISREQIENDYIPRGFNVFKLSGRFNFGSIIMNLVTYFVKPEYREDVTELFINHMMSEHASLWC